MATKMTREEALNKVRQMSLPKETMEIFKALAPELAESEDEKIRKRLIEYLEGFRIGNANVKWEGLTVQDVLAWLEKQKENPKSADSIPSDCTSDAKCEDRWHKVGDSLPDNGRLVLAKDCLGNVLLARYDGENWEVNVYDNEDHYCHNSISKWCEIPSEKQKEQKSVPPLPPFDDLIPEDKMNHPLYLEGFDTGREVQKVFDEQKPAEWSEEDEKDMAHIIRILDDCYVYGTHDLSKTDHENLVNKLKSLRPSWKPSEEQMKAVKHAYNSFPNDCLIKSNLRLLYHDLEKLM